MTVQKLFAAPGVGLAIDTETCYLYNRTGAVRNAGDIVMLDIADTDAGTDTSTTEGASSSILANAILPTTAQMGAVSAAGAAQQQGTVFFIVAEDNVADDALMKCVVEGAFVKASLVDSGTDITIGQCLYPINGSAQLTNLAAAAGQKCVAVAQEATAVTGLFKVWFSGRVGFGRHVVS